MFKKSIAAVSAWLFHNLADRFQVFRGEILVLSEAASVVTIEASDELERVLKTSMTIKFRTLIRLDMSVNRRISDRICQIFSNLEPQTFRCLINHVRDRIRALKLNFSTGTTPATLTLEPNYMPYTQQSTTTCQKCYPFHLEPYGTV